MPKVRFAIVMVSICALLLAGSVAFAGSKEKSERWYGVYYQGDKEGRAHSQFTDFTKDGTRFRQAKSMTYVKVQGTASYSGANVKKTKQWTFELNAKHDVLCENGKVMQITSRRTGTKRPILRAKGKTVDGVLVLQRTEGVIDKTLRIKPEDYDLVSDPKMMEPFLETVTETPVEKNVFSLGDAQVKKQTFVRLADDKTEDVDGMKKPCKTYKVTDEDGTVTMKTVNGKIVYIKHMDNESDSILKFYWTSKKRATSDTGY